MKKFIATSLAFMMLFASLSEPASAATKKSIFNRPMNLGCSVKYDMPSFSQASNSDENMSVFYSSQGKLTLQNPDALTKNSYVSVNVAQPRKERKWWMLWLGKDNVDYGENRFSLRLSDNKAAWWQRQKKTPDGKKNEGVYVKYALVLTSKDDEKILETPEVKEGQKKKEVLDAEKFRKEVEKYYGKDKVAEFKETYINRLLDGIKSDPNLDPYDPFNVAEAGHLDTLQVALPAMDRNSYYTKKEADEVNKKIREDKSKVLTKLAQKCGDELITEGEVAKLSQINKEQTFRLIVNNNIGEGGEADKLVLLLSNLAATGQSIEDDSSISFVSYVQSVLPDRFNNPLTEADRSNINRAYEALQAAKYKPDFFKWLKNLLWKLDIFDWVKDFIWWIKNSSNVPALPVATTDNAVAAKEKQIKELDNKVAEANKQLDETKNKLEEIEKQSRIDTQNMQKQQELLNMQQQLYAMKQAQEVQLINAQQQLELQRQKQQQELDETKREQDVQLDNAQKALLSYQDSLNKERQELQKAQREFEQERSKGFWGSLFGKKPLSKEQLDLQKQQQELKLQNEKQQQELKLQEKKQQQELALMKLQEKKQQQELALMKSQEKKQQQELKLQNEKQQQELKLQQQKQQQELALNKTTQELNNAKLKLENQQQKIANLTAINNIPVAYRPTAPAQLPELPKDFYQLN